MSAFWTLLKRDLLLQVREGGAVGTALGFYLVVVTLMPLGLGPDLNLLSRIAPGVLWIALLLSALLSLPRIFEADDEDGSLEVIATGDLPLELATAAKALAHWISTGIPLALLAPVLGLLLNLDLAAYPVLVATMLAGTPAISFLGATTRYKIDVGDGIELSVIRQNSDGLPSGEIGVGQSVRLVWDRRQNNLLAADVAR